MELSVFLAEGRSVASALGALAEGKSVASVLGDPSSHYYLAQGDFTIEVKHHTTLYKGE